MTKQSDVKDDPNFISVLDHGFVGLLDHLGSDSDIANSARLSYGKGTRRVSEDRTLIRYLIRHHHDSPIEMGVVKFHIKMPIFVARQLVRHRTASWNEQSARYSIIEDEFYIPDLEVIQPQSQTNKQGRDGTLSNEQKNVVSFWMKNAYRIMYRLYNVLLGEKNKEDEEYEELLGDDFSGISRELARIVLPVGMYTEIYLCINLRNLLHLLHLRTDVHAQYEIRAFAEAMLRLVEPLYPLVFEAWTDYVKDARIFSRMEMQMMRDTIRELGLLDNEEKVMETTKSYGMTRREISEFISSLKE